jgi:SAM-dependent methyltransferase
MSASPPTRFELQACSIDSALRYSRAIELLRDVYRPDMSILELGSGSAGLAEFLQHEITGVDPAFDRTETRAVENLRQVSGTADKIPFDDGTFDAVVSLDMMEHLSRDQRVTALREMLRVTKPEGRLIVAFPAGSAAARADRKLNNLFLWRYGGEHPWIREHIELGLPSTRDVNQMVAVFKGHRVRTVAHMWTPAWLGQQFVYSLFERSRPTRWLGLETRVGIKAFFHVFRRLNFRPAYRTFIVVTKATK